MDIINSGKSESGPSGLLLPQKQQHAGTGIPTEVMSCFSTTKMEYITGNLSAGSEETRGLAATQQKMELREAALNTLAPAGLGGRQVRTGLLQGTCSISLFFVNASH